MNKKSKNKTIAALGIDLAKTSFQLHGVNDQGIVVYQKKLSRTKLLEFIKW